MDVQVSRDEKKSLERNAGAEVAGEMVPGERLFLEVLERGLVEEPVLEIRDVLGLPAYNRVSGWSRNAG